jgi:capsid protein
VDPQKEAQADHTRLGDGSLTYAAYYAKRGKDWKREERQRIRELVTREVMWNEERRKANLPPAPYPDGFQKPQAPVAIEEPETDLTETNADE